jgi:hypothetical protein
MGLPPPLSMCVCTLHRRWCLSTWEACILLVLDGCVNFGKISLVSKSVGLAPSAYLSVKKSITMNGIMKPRDASRIDNNEDIIRA